MILLSRRFAPIIARLINSIDTTEFLLCVELRKVLQKFRRSLGCLSQTFALLHTVSFAGGKLLIFVTTSNGWPVASLDGQDSLAPQRRQCQFGRRDGKDTVG